MNSQWMDLKLTSEAQKSPVDRWQWTQPRETVPEFLQGTPLHLWQATFEATEKVILDNLQSVEEVKLLKRDADTRFAKIVMIAVPIMAAILVAGVVALGLNIINPGVGWTCVGIMAVVIAVVVLSEMHARYQRSQAIETFKKTLTRNAEELRRTQQGAFDELFIHVSLLTREEYGLGGSEGWDKPIGLRFSLMGSDRPLSSELQRLHQLHMDGGLSESEFEMAKKRVMGGTLGYLGVSSTPIPVVDLKAANTEIENHFQIDSVVEKEGDCDATEEDDSEKSEEERSEQSDYQDESTASIV